MRLSTKVPDVEPCIADALRRLDTMQEEVTTFEADFLNDVMRGVIWTDNRRRVLATMCEDWLGDLALAEAIRGQERVP